MIVVLLQTLPKEGWCVHALTMLPFECFLQGFVTFSVPLESYPWGVSAS